MPACQLGMGGGGLFYFFNRRLFVFYINLFVFSVRWLYVHQAVYHQAEVFALLPEPWKSGATVAKAEFQNAFFISAAAAAVFNYSSLL